MCDTTQILLGDGLIDCRTTSNTPTVVVCDRSPPASLALDVPQDEVLDRGRHARERSGDVRIPATPCIGKVPKECLRHGLPDQLRHHVENVVDDECARLEVVMSRYTPIGKEGRDTLAVTTLELTMEQIHKHGSQI